METHKEDNKCEACSAWEQETGYGKICEHTPQNNKENTPTYQTGFTEFVPDKSIPWKNNKEEWEKTARQIFANELIEQRFTDMFMDYIHSLLTHQKQSIMKEIALEIGLNNAVLSNQEIHHIDKYKAEGANQALSDLKERISKL